MCQKYNSWYILIVMCEGAENNSNVAELLQLEPVSAGLSQLEILYSHPKQRFHHWPAMWTGEQLALYQKKNFSVYFLQVLLRVRNSSNLKGNLAIEDLGDIR
ncbi:hypothetical protein Y1Q_0006371 [Alligator mississippiensis]|uniref:Uncharacterized protein n=1 Tax=Alligator mississippiensis TaxID=8496 RepID=A0A151NXM2_ALLMI|nr:hypothetical protein Y1Q_0006371 [Alligator mississippiensis]